MKGISLKEKSFEATAMLAMIPPPRELYELDSEADAQEHQNSSELSSVKDGVLTTEQLFHPKRFIG